MNDERQARIKAINDAVKKQLCYGLLGFCVLTGIVFAFIYPDLAKNDEATVSSGIILSMIIVAALGSPILLVVAIARGSSSSNYSSGTSSGGGCGGGCGGGGCGGGG